MNKVRNREAIRRLALREMKSDRRMVFVLVLSVVLTCIMFTALTSVGGSLINGVQQETMRQVGGNRMAGVKYVLREDYEKIKADSKTRDVVYHTLVGDLENVKNIRAEVNCAGDEDAAKAGFSAPEEGRMPESFDEIAVSTLVLDEFGLPHELGTKIHIELSVDGEITEHDMTLCGYWKGDKVSMAQQCWVSRDFADKYAPEPDTVFASDGNIKYAGYYMVDLNFANSWDIEGKTAALLSRIYSDGENIPQAGVNWAYTTSSVDGGTLACGIVMLFVVFAAGYLIIYNIFYINISTNIRSYGLLKTIGTTSRQIRRMVRIQAAVYSAIGIPVGIVSGLMLGKVMTKSIMRIMNVYSENSYAVSTKLLALICLISAVFTFATVMISCRKPCRIAAGVSPIEALRYNETDIHTKKKSKKSAKVTPLSIARNNMMRSRKKTVTVVLSLTLSMVLVNTLFTVLSGVDEDKFIKDSIVGDIVIKHSENTQNFSDKINGITPEMIGEFEQAEGAEVHPVYFDYGSILPDDEACEKVKMLYEKNKDSGEHMEDLKAAVERKKYQAYIYGIDEETANYIEAEEGSIDIEKLKSGRYVIVNTYLWSEKSEDENYVHIYHPGDMIELEDSKGEKHEYEVMAVGTMPYPLSIQMYGLFFTQVVMYDEEFKGLAETLGASKLMINTDDESGRVKEQCKAICEKDGSQLVYTDKQTYIDEFSGLMSMIKLVGGSLAGTLALIGILNFVNAVVTGIMTRKRELAMMNAVGMTDVQQKKMLMWEGIHYAVLTAVWSVIIGSGLSLFMGKNMEDGLFFFSYRFTLLPIMICLLILLLLSAAIPYVSYKVICSDSVVDRMREN